MCTQVIVLEKGGFTPAAELPLTEQEAFRDMYEMGSLFTTQDAGKCLSCYLLSGDSGTAVLIAGCTGSPFVNVLGSSF